MLWQLSNISLTGDNCYRLQEISLDIDDGVTAIMGHSGAGKTSLLNLLVGFEKPDQGKIQAEIAQKKHALPVFWVPANFGLWPHLKVSEHIRAVMPDRLGDVDKILSQFAIADKKDLYPSQLSSGESSRLAIARGLAADPAVLVMDEPLMNVDPARKLYFWDIIVNQASEMEISLVYVSHSPRYVTGFADSIICLENGEIVFNGTVEDLYHAPPTRELAHYLGEINWFTDDEMNFANCRCLRPEQLNLILDAEGKFEVLQSRFMGEITETELKDRKSGGTKTIFHRPAGNFLKKGNFVMIEEIIQ